MSGLVALYHPDGRPVEQPCLDKMTVALAHRGTDGSGLWRDGPVGLGHRMRWTTPESLHETLPLALPDKKLAITADARLDNRDELIAALDVADRAIPDSALILLAYDRWGEACPEKLLGDFAFVLWDGRRGAIFCARDHIGVKPFFYYHKTGRLFACASEIKALLCLPDIPQRLNEARVGECLGLLLDDKETTFYHEILRLPPGHRLTVDPKGARLDAYWALDPHRSLEGRSNDEYAQEFRWLFTEAVRARMRSAFPIGSMLSGGLDSSSVTCTARGIAAAQGKGPLHTFSLVFDDVPSCDERGYIQAVVEQSGLTPHFVRGDKVSPLSDFEQVLGYEDEPFLPPNLFLVRALYETASKNGVQVLLDGVDGDSTVFHGEGYLRELVRAGRILAVLRELRGIARHGRLPWRRACRVHVISPLIPDWLRRAYRSFPGRRPHETTETRMRSLICPDFAKRIHLIERVREDEARGRTRPRTVREAHWHRLNHGSTPFGLEVIDHAASRFGIESRHPFFDRRLLEFCLALPADQKMFEGWTRIVLRRAMEGILPEAIRWRPGKSNLSPNFAHSLIVRDRERLDKWIRAYAPVLEEYVDMRKLNKVYSQGVERPNMADAMTLWNAVTIGLWLSRKWPLRESLGSAVALR